MNSVDRFDVALKDWIVRAAPASAPPQLHQQAMLRIRSRRQHLSASAAVRAAVADSRLMGGLRFGPARVATVVALLLLAALLFMLAAGGRLPVRPSPTPTPAPLTVLVGGLPAAFTFSEPDAATLVRVLNTPEIQGFADAPAPASAVEYGEMQRASSHGVALGALGTPWVHHCESYPSDHMRVAPADFLDDLATASRATLDPIIPTTFDGHPALTTTIWAGANGCSPDVHVTHGPTRGSKYLLLSIPSRLTVFSVGGTTFVLDVWAQTDADLEAWLPAATAFTDSIRFVDASTQDFVAYLAGYGQELTLSPAPEGLLDWHPAVKDFPFPGAVVSAATYGTVTCFGPSLNCATRGLARPGASVPIWLVTFVDSPPAQGCPLWATVAATTGEFLNGSGPPCN
jgi:hypothetical protein